MVWNSFKKNGLQPHKSEYWIFPKIEDEAEFVERITNVCETYKEALLPNSKTVVTCTDEKTGIQAINNIKIKPAEKDKPRKIDPEYIRNGTACLMAGLDVETGKTAHRSLGQTRNEIDFLEHIQGITATNPDAQHIIVCDQLNTHKSESLVNWVAEQIKFKGELGVKGKSGILQSMKSRMSFLEDKSHKIRFQFTPKHCSWMNQIENWFGFLQKRVIKYGQFRSVEILEQKIDDFINYYDRYLAKPINWLFSGDKYIQKLTN